MGIFLYPTWWSKWRFGEGVLRKCRTFEVRDKTVVYEPNMINTILQVDKPSHEEFRRFGRDVTYADTCSILSPKRKKIPEAHKPFYFTRKELTREGKAWIYFISGHLMPTTSKSEVHFARVVLVAAIIKGIEINVGEITYQEIRRCINDLLSPFFPSLITALCDAYSVPEMEGDRSNGVAS